LLKVSILGWWSWQETLPANRMRPEGPAELAASH